MSSYNAGAGCRLGGNNGGLPQGVTQAKLDEIKSFNSGLTRAGNKSRPPRSRGSGVNRGRGSGISPGRSAGYAGSGNTPRSGSGVGYGAGPSYSVGPSTPSSIEKSNLRDRVPIHLRGMADTPKTRWTNLDSASAGTLGGHKIGPLNSAATPHIPRSRSPTRSSILVKHTAQPPQTNTTNEQQLVRQTLQQPQAAQVITPPSCQRIVTNMTLDDPSKPFIPAHLHQNSCRVAIQEIAQMKNMPLSEVTSDGVSIPAARLQAIENAAIPTNTSTTVASSTLCQSDVDPNGWLGNLSKNKKSNTEANVAVNSLNMQMMLSESKWAPAAGPTNPQNGFAVKFSAPTESYVQADSSSAVDVEMTGAPSILGTPLEALSDHPINEMLITMPTLEASRWATTQPFTNSKSSSGSSWPGSSGTLFAPKTVSENTRPILSEAAPGTFSGFSDQENTSSSWEFSVNTFPSITHSQSEQFRGFNSSQNNSSVLKPRVFDKSKATPEELMEHRLRCGMPLGYIAPHLLNLPPNHGAPVPSWSTENIKPTQPSSQPKEEEKKVAYLKDSMWAC